MFDISVQTHARQLEDDTYLTQLSQLGVDCVDIAHGSLPGTEDQGHPDLEALRQLKKRLRSHGLRINRVTLPTIGGEFMRGETDDRSDIERAVRTLEVFGEADLPLARQRFAGDVFPDQTETYDAVQRGGLRSRGERLTPGSRLSHDQETAGAAERPSTAALDHWWDRFYDVYDELVPVADETGVKLAMHPSDPPNYHVPFDSIGLHRIVDRYQSPQVGFIYCVGTRAQAGGSSLVLDELTKFGREDRLFTVHMRNIRGSLATAGRFEETLLDDGDLDIYRILETLDRVGFSGCVNPDHVPEITGDTEHEMISWGYGIAYLKAMTTALASRAGTRR